MICFDALGLGGLRRGCERLVLLEASCERRRSSGSVSSSCSQCSSPSSLEITSR